MWRMLATVAMAMTTACGGAASSGEPAMPTSCPEAAPEGAIAATHKPESPENHRAAALHLFEVTELPKTMAAAVDTMMRTQISAMPELAHVEHILKEFLVEHAGWEATREDFIDIYVDAFTQRELELLAAFSATDVGRKSVEVTPKLIEQGALVGQLRVKENLPKLMQRLEEHMRQNPPPARPAP